MNGAAYWEARERAKADALSTRTPIIAPAQLSRIESLFIFFLVSFPLVLPV